MTCAGGGVPAFADGGVWVFLAEGDFFGDAGGEGEGEEGEKGKEAKHGYLRF